MNEKIKELAKQARAEVRAEWYRENEIQYPNGHYVFQMTVDQKFAELIIRECCQLLIKEGDAWEEFSHNPPQGQENNATAALFAAFRLKEDAVARLEEHFGVDK